MSVSLRWIAVLALIGLAGLNVGEAAAQPRPARPGVRPLQGLPPRQALPPGFNLGRTVRPLPFPGRNVTQFTPESVAAANFAYNASLIGAGLSSIPPYAFGYNPYPSPIISSGGVVAPSPYALSTAGGYNPYATAGSLSSSPYGGYSMSTTPYGSAGSPYSNPYGQQDPYGSYLQGIASVTSATGQYYNQIQQARITREQSRQMAIETQRKQIEFEMWYETVRPTAPKLIARERATNLDEARNWASSSKIWSGDALNQLLNSILRSGALNRVPSSEATKLSEDTLKNLNLTAKATRGNVGLLKDGVKLNWPIVLQEGAFDETRKRLTLKIRDAVEQLKEKLPVSATTLKDTDALYKTLSDKLNDSADDLSPSQYIEAKRYLNQVGQAIQALKDPKAGKYFDNSWNAKGKNVGELVDHMRKEGLEFAPATPGDEAAYTALYNAFRVFEASMQSRKSSRDS